MKVIIDTNILVSVLLSPSRRSASYKVFEMCLKRQLQPQVGCALFNEYEDVLARPHIQERSSYPAEEIEQILDGFLSVCTWSKVHYLWRPNLKDEGDNHLIDLAVASNATHIITKNIKDLNSGDLRFGFRSVTPENFLEVYHGNNNLSHH
ncbi:putative toxin-antitoxin system toxin component, PIN family [Endozoicomonas sp. SM1973]|uniref:Toxin-antitoxin system toxin component, PIN family n=1 Tax=Spartinivicinus marinus TaxID=2994442 RepID=A0A853IHS3_9GAMM|nr:putative toxin-antitoxin system toxin component, PIN family [Spartinivicinus marinus]NYZ69601.1 putative toxin-antitoxin system toxin component, PIN family [Spartinivicinus marinus]